MVGLLRRKEWQFASLDTTWQIDAQSFIGMAEDMGGRRLGQKVEQMMPTRGRPQEVSAVLQQLHVLQASALDKFCSMPAQG
mmetsp:Transcript_83132/g.214196  ORF Transcript_83132/g.214196 Transcript_83132/m.214196 type:complete len:81 (-) Transcript_83132:530-772(-)